MISKLKVKVVKRTELSTPKPVVAKAAAPRTTARDMVSTVTEWVTDFKERKGMETKAAIESFFAAHPRFSES